MIELSHNTFYRYKAAVDENGVELLLDKARKKNLKNRVEDEVEKRVIEHAIDHTAHGHYGQQ